MLIPFSQQVVMPVIGFVSAYLLSLFYYVPQEIAGSFYLVLIIVFLCPTANNVMVMVELSGSGSKEGMARIIAFQYMISPIVLSLTVTVAVFMAQSM
jgi:predicted permease